MKNNIRIMLIIIAVVLSMFVSGICYAEEDLTYHPLFEILNKERIVGLGVWNVEDTSLFCIIAWHTKEEDTFQRKKMFIFQHTNEHFIKIYEQTKIGEGFDSMDPVNQDLLTIWGTGSGLTIRVFSFIDHAIQTTLEVGTQQFPEILDIDNDGQEEIFIVSSGKLLMNAGDHTVVQYPETTDIYKSDGKKYYLLKTVPWKSRFCQEEH